MASFNKVILIGNLCADPELKQTPSGVGVTSFPLAVGRRKAAKEKEPQTDFITIVAWRSTAEFICKYFQKGKSILIVGALQTRNWTDQNGQKRYVTEVMAEEAYFVEKKADASAVESASVPYASGSDTPQFLEMTSDDDLPF